MYIQSSIGTYLGYTPARRGMPREIEFLLRSTSSDPARRTPYFALLDTTVSLRHSEKRESMNFRVSA